MKLTMCQRSYSFKQDMKRDLHIFATTDNKFTQNAERISRQNLRREITKINSVDLLQFMKKEIC
jgi:hypothetical protein